MNIIEHLYSTFSKFSESTDLL